MTSEAIFKDLNAEDPGATEVESLCMNCYANGLTKILLTKIPFYKEVVLMSFSCNDCGFKNNEIQSGAEISANAIKITLRVENEADLNRTVVKSDYTNVKIPELDFEIPSKSQKGEITTVEGIISRSVRGLEQDQTLRRKEHPEAAAQIDSFIQKLNELINLTKPFTLIIEDISGNSFMENPNAPHTDQRCLVHYFKRNKDQDHELGIFSKEEVSAEKEGVLQPIDENEFTLEDLQGEVLQLPTNCTNCSAPCQTNMKLTNIPHFKEVVIMATSCDSCGHRTNEVKSGAGIEPKGVCIKITVKNKEDFSRDILKSDTCDLKIPQLELEVGPNALGGRFTTVEGLLIAIRDQIKNPSGLFTDSQNEESKERYKEFFTKFDAVLNGELEITLVLDDPAGNSYVQLLSDEGKSDDSVTISSYERSFEQNEELGLNDMKTENYS